MGFTDLKSDAGLAVLNDYISDKSYIEGFTASQADVAVFEAMTEAPEATKYAHAARWYKYIASFSAEFATLAGEKKEASEYGPAAKAAPAPKADDDDVDLFASDDEEDAEAERLKAQRLEEYRAKKAAKGPGPAAKSSVLIDVKPWDNETDLAEMERQVRAISMDGLKWGGSQLVPIGYGIQKLQINCIVEDDKVGTDILEEAICGLEDLVQSIDIAAFNKI